LLRSSSRIMSASYIDRSHRAKFALRPNACKLAAKSRTGAPGREPA
jgi:hypothetical protein